jgi:RNA polymerase sigma factor (sigma-70 family)
MEATGQNPRVVSTDWQSFVPKDVAGTAEWLLSEPAFSQLLYIALLNLSAPATRNDAEEAVQDFLVNHLPNVLRCYSPGEGSFWSYLVTAFQRECWRQGNKLRARLRRHPQLPPGGLPDRAPDATITGLLEQAELRATLEMAGTELDPRAWQAIRLHHVENQGVEAIAQQLRITLQNAKVLLHRGRQELAELLRWHSCCQLRPRHVHNWPAFCKIMRQEAEQQLRSVPAALWAALDRPAQDLVQQVAQSAEPADQDLACLVQNMNAALLRPDLWPKALVSALRARPDLSPEDQQLLRRRKRGAISMLRLNRLVLEFGFPDLVAASKLGDADHE